MTDVVDKATRSRMMSGIRGKDTKPELKLRKGLHALGFRYRTNAGELPGRPDIVLRKYGAVVFVHGCFWHRHEGCRLTTTPNTRREFWQRKFASNVKRDARNLDTLRALGWRTAIVWECALRGEGAASAISSVASWLQGTSAHLALGADRAIGEQ